MEKDNSLKNDNKYTKNSLHILDLQEADRQRIARELHDSSLQRLAHTLHKIELCDNYLDVDMFKARMELMDISQNIKTVVSEIRNTIHNLRPMSFDDLGIEQAYLQFLDSINANKIVIYNNTIGFGSNLNLFTVGPTKVTELLGNTINAACYSNYIISSSYCDLKPKTSSEIKTTI